MGEKATAMIVTCWYRDVGDGPKFNHMSNGYHEDHDEPAYVTEEQRKAWENCIWIPRRAELIDGKVIGGGF